MQSNTFALRSFPVPKSVRDAGPTEPKPIAEALAPTLFMPTWGLPVTNITA
jgi:hypothetical protein